MISGENQGRVSWMISLLSVYLSILVSAENQNTVDERFPCLCTLWGPSLC